MAVPVQLLAELARSKLVDAEVLLANQRFDAGFYLCGYSVELALKARICRTLDWSGYPESQAELKIFRQFQSHDLDMLLALSGQDRRIRGELTAEWSIITSRWSPEMRYRALDVTAEDLQDAITAARTLVDGLL